MERRRPRVAAWGLLALASPALGQLPFGPERQANGYTTSSQQAAEVASAPDGTFVVAWRSEGSPGDDSWDSSVQAQRFGNAGGPLGAQFQVNEVTYSAQFPTGVWFDADGEFTVLWSTVFNGPGYLALDGDVRRFAASGTPLGGEFVVSGAYEYSGAPVGAGRPDGSFVVVRDSYGEIEVARFDATGTSQGVFTIAPATSHYLTSPSVTVAPDGEFVVAWTDSRPGSYPETDEEIRFQRFDAAAAPVGPVVDVTGPNAVGDRWGPRMARNASGGFLVVWTDRVSTGGDTEGTSIQGRAYDASGAPLGAQLQINQLTLGSQDVPDLAAAPDGSFIVTWTDWPNGTGGGGDGSDRGVRARHLSPDGTPRSSSFLVNSLTTGDQSYPSVSVLPGGNFLIAWSSEVSAGSDTSEESIQFRRFRAALFADGFESGSAARWVSGGA